MAKIVKKSLLGRKKSNKPLQYAVGGVVSIIVLVLWITSPGRSSSFSAAAIAAGNPFSSRVTDISVLSTSTDGEKVKTEAERMADEMGSHDGGNGLLSSLFQTGFDEESSDDSEMMAAAGDAPDTSDSFDDYDVPSASPASGGSVSDSARAKLSALGSSSKGGGGGGSTGISSHNKFFGSGSANATTKKVDVNTGNVKSSQLTDRAKNTKSVESLKAAERFASNAVQSRNLGQATALNSLAFDGGIKKGTVEAVDSGLSQTSTEASLGFGEAIKDLKTNDPKLNKNKVVPPANKAKDVTNDDDDMKKYILQLLFQNVIGPVLQGALK